jgi:hypothetical protein
VERGEEGKGRGMWRGVRWMKGGICGEGIPS